MGREWNKRKSRIGNINIDIYKGWSGMTASKYKEYKNIRKESLCDNMTDIEVALTDLGEIATKTLVNKKRPNTFEKHKELAKLGGKVSKDARDSLENKLG